VSDANIPSLSTRFGHDNCIMCGKDNPLSLKLCFQKAEDGSVSTLFSSTPSLQGYKGIMHGGIIAALLDCAMTHCLFHHGVEAVTADLQVRYPHAIPCDAELVLRAVILSNKPPLYLLRAEATQHGRVMAWSKAKFLMLRTAAP
jgi:acyl-coenzyme A thioesterase PaaI-like protein